MSARVESTPDTMLSDFQKHTGIAPEAARGDMEGLAEANRAGSVRPAYQAALAQPVTMTPELANVLQEPEVITAVNQAKRLVGQNATTMGIKIDPATGAPVLDPLTMKPVLEEQPTAATLDQAKKFLAKGITRNPITGAPVTSGAGASENVFIQQHLGNLTDALAGNPDKNIAPAIPGYREALDAAGDTLKMEQAFKLGQDHILNPRVAAADVQAQVAKMSPSEIQAYQGGQANTLFAKAQNGLLAPKKLMTPAVRSKLAATLGPDKADAFLTDIKHTQAMLNNARQIAPQAGSQTAPLSAEMKAQDNPGGLRGILGGAAQDFIMGTVAGGGHPAMGLHLAGLNVGRKVSGLLGDFVNEKTMPVGVRNEVGGILGATGEGAMTPDQLAALIKAQKSQKALPPKVPALTWVGRPDKPSLGILGAPATGFVAGSAQQR